MGTVGRPIKSKDLVSIISTYIQGNYEKVMIEMMLSKLLENKQAED